MVNKGQTVVTGINPKTNKKESFYYKSRNSTKNWDNGQVKVAKLKRRIHKDSSCVPYFIKRPVQHLIIADK